MFLNNIRNIFDIPWNDELTYGAVRRQEEVEQSLYSFREADPQFLRAQFEAWEREAARLLERTLESADGPKPAPLVLPAYECALQCSHLFNVLDARGAVSVTERAGLIQRIRRLACRAADGWVAERTAAGHPLLARERVAS
jgi:glycyl-tRNA synthetase alpha chain